MESFDKILVIFLLITNVVQFIYWTREFQKLIDKHMSKNYADYVASKEYRAVLPRPTLQDAQAEQALEDDVLKELNQLLPRV